MKTTDDWLFELTNRVSASSGLTESDRQARIEHLRLAFASLVDFDVHMAQQQQAKRYAEIWHTHERPDWIDPPEALWRMVNQVVDNLKYIDDIAISQLLGPIEGLTELSDNLRNMSIDDAIDSIRAFSAAYVQSLYETYNGQNERQNLSDVRESLDDAHRPVQMPTTSPRPYEQLITDVNASLDKIISYKPKEMPTPVKPQDKKLQPNTQVELETDTQSNLQVEPETNPQPNSQVEVEVHEDGGVTIDNLPSDDQVDPNEYAVYGSPHFSDYVEEIQDALDPYGEPIQLSDNWNDYTDDDATDIVDDNYDVDYREDLNNFDSHYGDPHLSASREDELLDDVDSDDDDDT